MGAPIGNNNASKVRDWSDAIRRAVARRGNGDQAKGLNTLADKLLAKVEEGDMAAIKEFGDRYEGKIPQATEISGPSGGPVEATISVEFIRKPPGSV